jgi:hypothetical protein
MELADEHADKVSSLPPAPLRDKHLAGLLDREDVAEVWVPEDRPESVATGGGEIEHSGDILDFWIELGDKYVPLRYTSPDGVDGVAWYRFLPTGKDEPAADMVTATLEDYRPLSDSI